MNNCFKYINRHDNYSTPQDLYNNIIQKNNLIDFNPKEIYYKNSLLKENNNYYCNPPFSNIEPFVDYMIENNKKGFKSFMLLPIRLNTNWFIKLLNYGCEITILGRLKYNNLNTSAPFDSMLVNINRENNKIAFLRESKNINTIQYKQISIYDLM